MAHLEEILKEAREKNLKFRRVEWPDGDIVSCDTERIISVFELLASDWEIVEEKRELSAREIRDAITNNYCGSLDDYTINEIIKELGFKDE